MRHKIKLKRLKATIYFNLTSAKTQTNIAYYKTQMKNMRDYVNLEQEKKRLGTLKSDFVTKILDSFKRKGKMANNHL
jgi:hypothetical protein